MRNAGLCASCKCEVWIPDALYESAHKSAKIGFFCAYGHSLVFPEGESEETKLRRERDRLQQRLAEKDDELNGLELRRRAAVGQITKLKNRVGRGVCPCCNRTFGNLAAHMNTQHPTFTAEAAE